MVALADVLGPARSYQAIFPTLEKYITQRILVVSAESLSEGLMPPIPKATYEKSLAVVGDAKSTPETLASIEYFSGMAASLRGDLHRYFREVINKSNSYNLTRTRKQGKKHARTGSIDVRLMDPGRATKVFSTPLDPFTKSAPQTDSKRFRGKHSAAKAAAEAKAVESIDAPKGTETILQAAFDIPQFSQRQEALPKSPGLSTSWFFRRSRPRRRAEAKRGSDSRSNAWVPQGILVGELSHDAAVNQIEISQDNRFMASCSNDGTVKIWDGTELAKVQTSFTAEPAFVYEEQGGRITGLAICEGTRTIASASTDGSIHVLTVDYSSDSLRGTNFQRIKTEKEGSITAISHAKTPSRSTLVYATQKGYVHGWDFRRKKEAFVLDLKSYVGELGARGFGLVTTTTIGPSNLTLFVGTSHGYIVLWDLRYRLATSIWRHSSKTAILAMSVAGPDAIPVKAKTNTKAPVLLVSAAGAPEISVFDVYTGECRSVLRVVDTANGFPGKSSGNWTKVRTGSVSSDRASGKIPQSESPIRSINPLSLPSLRGCNRRQAGVTEAFVAEFTATACDEKARQGGGRGITCFLCHEGEGVLTGGKDRVVRYWDVNNTERSHRVVKSYEGQFVYRFSRRSENSTVLYEEHTLRQLDASHGAGSAGPTWQLRRGAVSRETVHLDHITDMQAFEFPNKRLVTADRSGRIKIWR